MPPVGTSQTAEELGSELTSDRLGATDRLIYDVGMNRGDDAAFYLALGYDVVGFEVDRVNAAHCRSRFAQEIDLGRLTVFEGSGLEIHEPLQQHGVPHFMKVGARSAVRRCLELLASAQGRPRFLSIASATSSWAELIEDFELLEGLDYGRYAVVERAKVSGRIVRTSDRFGSPLEYRFKSGSSGSFGGDLAPWLKRDSALAQHKKLMRNSRRLRLGRTGPGVFDTHAMLTH